MSKLQKEKLLRFLDRGVGILPARFVTQDANRLTLVYFGLSALDVIGELGRVDKFRNDIIELVYSMQISYAMQILTKAELDLEVPVPALKHDYAHIANTYVALCILKMLGDDFSRVNRAGIVEGIRAIQGEDGSFRAMECGSESDLRFVFCAAAVCAMINDWSGFDKDRAEAFVLKCKFQSWDNGFGQGPEQEAHGGSTYCALAALSLMGRLDAVPDREQLIRWLVELQVNGFHGRVEKLDDTCYSCCQHMIGGFGKVPGATPDPLHTYFSLCALGMCGEDGFEELNYELGMTRRAAGSPTVFD